MRRFGFEMKRKAFTLLICFTLFASLFTLFSCKKKQPAPKPLVLFLGDSIAEAVAGPTPLTERESYGYYGIIGNINEYEYYNRGVSGSTTQNLLRYVQKENDGINMVETLISTADVIHISIIGNDLLNTNHSDLMLAAADGDTAAVLRTKEEAKANIASVIDRIRSLNPDVTLLLQTLYNPAGEDSPLVPYRARVGLASRGYSSADYHRFLGETVRIMNTAFYELLEERSYTAEDGKKVLPFELIDVYGTIENIYATNKTRYDTLFCEDGIHPSNAGHAVIAELIQEKLVELSLAGKNALSRYKEIRTAQLSRLFSGKAPLSSILAAIENATDFGSVTEAYFEGTKGLTPTAELTLNYQGKHFDETLDLRFETLTVMGDDFAALLDEEKSYLTFRPDGSFEASVTLDKITKLAILYAIDQNAPMDLTRDYRLSLLDPYIYNIVPEADPTDILSIVRAFERAYGVTFEMIDFESESAKKAMDTYRDTGRVVLEDSTFLKDEITLRARGQYRLETVTARDDGRTYTAIYLNAGIDKSEPYVRFTYTENERGEKKARMIVDVAETVIEATSKR